MGNEHHTEPFEYSDTALRLALSVILDAAAKASNQAGKPQVDFPCTFEGQPMTVRVLPDDQPAEQPVATPETPKVFPCPVNTHGIYEGGSIHLCRTQDDRYVLDFENEEGRKLFALVSSNPDDVVTCETHGTRKGGFLVDLARGTLKQEKHCSECVGLLSTLDEPEMVAPGVPFGKAVEEPAIKCPLGKDPCQLNNPTCNVSPGLYQTAMHGKQVEMCGECVEQCGGEVLGQARSIDKLTAVARPEDDQFRGADRSTAE